MSLINKSYNRSPKFELYIQGDGYKLWYDKELDTQFNKLEKDSAEWKTFQEARSELILEHLFYNRESGMACVIAKSRYKMSYDKILNHTKKLSNATLIESDQRMVNNTPVLYIKLFTKKDGNNIMLSTYYINADSGMLVFMILVLEDNYEKYRKMIEEGMNGIELD